MARRHCAMMKNGQRYSRLEPDQIPASAVNANVVDPASYWEGAPPNFGQNPVPHIFTVVGRQGMVARAYSNHHDEALFHDYKNARIMRNEPAIMECLEARMRCVAMLPYHIQPVYRDKQKYKDPQRQFFADNLTRRLKPRQSKWDAEEVASKLTEIIAHTPNFMKMRYCLADSLWYGRYGTTMQYGCRMIGGHNRIFLKRWEPRHGDKLVFRYDDGTGQYDPDQVGIRVGPGYDLDRTFIDFAGHERRKVEATEQGLVYWFDGKERKGLVVHKHIIEDADFYEPEKAGAIHGIGIRSRIYWTWWAYQECLKLLLEYTERSALGIEIWRYPAHNNEAKKRAETAAKEKGSGGRSILLVPVPAGEDAQLYGVEIVEPGLGGISELKDILQTFFGHKIKRYIMGQTLTSEAEGTGMGSGVADAHMATLHDINKFDAINEEETLTVDFLRVLQLANFPGSDDIWLQFHIDTESDDSQRKLDAYQAAWNMGAELKANDIYDIIGSSKPTEDDEVLKNPAFMVPEQPPAAPMMAGPMPGNPLAADPSQPDQQPPDDSQVDETAPVMFAADSEIDRYALTTLDELEKSSVDQPSESQSEAGDYRKAHIRLHGLDITIENPKGTRRKPEWPPLQSHYGYIRRTLGRDGDHVDCFIGPQPYSELVAVVDQVTQGGRFDEHKVVLGVTSEKQAKRVYLSNYSAGWICGPITMMTVGQFREWLDKGDTTKRVEPQVSRFAAELASQE